MRNYKTYTLCMVKAKINWQKNIFGIKLNMVIAAICYNTS